MTEAQRKLAALQIEQSEVRQKLNDLLSADDRTAEQNTELESLTSRAQGTASREAFRRFLHATVTPLLDAMAAEAAYKLSTPGLRFDTVNLHAADVQGRAWAFQSMVGGGLHKLVPVDDAMERRVSVSGTHGNTKGRAETRELNPGSIDPRYVLHYDPGA